MGVCVFGGVCICVYLCVYVRICASQIEVQFRVPNELFIKVCIPGCAEWGCVYLGVCVYVSICVYMCVFARPKLRYSSASRMSYLLRCVFRGVQNGGVCIWGCVYMCLFVCICVYMCPIVCICVYMCVNMYVFVSNCVYLCVNV